VGFSLNPVTNNFDEAVINSNWGLGETVVSGTATPDTYTINKITGEVKNKLIGKKETSVWLLLNGGTETKKDPRHDKLTMNDKQITQLTELIKKVEEHYKKPMDIEWAYANEKLYLLQARPITAYIPLSQDTQTLPGQKKRLYFDITTTAQGMDQPISVLGVSSFRRLVKIVGGIVFGRDISQDITTSIAWVASNGRLYANVSNLFRLFGKEKVAQALPIIDPIAAKAVQALNEDEYTSAVSKLALLPTGLFVKLPRILSLLLRAQRTPEQVHEETQKEIRAFEKDARMLAEKNLPLTQLWEELLKNMFYRVFLRTVPLTFASRKKFAEMKKMAGDNLQKEADRLELALPNNVTTEMGLRLSQAASYLPKDITYKTVQKRLKTNDLSPEFTTAWLAFLDRYGLRGPSEIDIAAPRYREDPSLLLDLMVTMRHAPPQENTQAKFERNAKERQRSYETIQQHLLSQNAKLASKFASSYRFFETFGGYRETHKYYLIFVVDLLRQKIVPLAEQLQKEGRLEKTEQVFYVTLEDLDRATIDKTIDLVAIAEKNKAERKHFEQIHYPSLIDSRGFIPRPAPAQTKKGVVIGTPISAGVVQGKIKILHTPTEKPLKKGEILVAKATDPGWTPLFVNAAAVVLEIGGVLQHGALVAREYGLPCVAGVENATTLWKDGTMVEINGSEGTIRAIS
jgi:pyruvate,water dikinase